MGMSSGKKLRSAAKSTKAKKVKKATRSKTTTKKRNAAPKTAAKKKPAKVKKSPARKIVNAKRKSTARAKKARPAARKPAVTKRGAARRSAAAPRKVAAAKDPNQALRDLAKRIVAVTAVNDDEGAFALYADDVVSVEPGRPATRGIGAVREKFAQWRDMVRDAKFKARRVCVDGKSIVIEWDGKATLRSNGKTVDLEEVAIHEIKGGKIARERFYYDPSSLAAAAQPAAAAPAPSPPPLFPLTPPEPPFVQTTFRYDPDDPEEF